METQVHLSQRLLETDYWEEGGGGFAKLRIILGLWNWQFFPAFFGQWVSLEDIPKRLQL